MNESGYYVGDGPGKPSGITPRTTAADYRKLTPLVLMRLAGRRSSLLQLASALLVPASLLNALLGNQREQRPAPATMAHFHHSAFDGEP
jgi:hypothetical protein